MLIMATSDPVRLENKTVLGLFYGWFPKCDVSRKLFIITGEIDMYGTIMETILWKE